jgi:hypothetical protein
MLCMVEIHAARMWIRTLESSVKKNNRTSGTDRTLVAWELRRSSTVRIPPKGGLMTHWEDQTISGNRKKERKESIHPRSTLMNTSLWAVINSWLQRLCVVSGQLVFLWLSKHPIAFYDQVSSRWVAWLQIYCMLYWTHRYLAQKTFTDYESPSKILVSFHRLDPNTGKACGMFDEEASGEETWGKETIWKT